MGFQAPRVGIVGTPAVADPPARAHRNIGFTLRAVKRRLIVDLDIAREGLAATAAAAARAEFRLEQAYA